METPVIQEVTRSSLLELRRKKAIEWLGAKWVLHPANRIKKLKEPLSLERTMQPKVLKAVAQ